MSHQKFESGRTLLETLAVLVVIAVLILAGIVGYNFAIKKYRETQTVKQVSELGVRYQLRPIQPGKNGLVDIKPVYPEAERVSAVEMKTADTETGRVSLQVQDTVSSFSIVVNQVLDDSCKAILTEGSYDSVLFKDGSEAYEDSKEYVAIGKDLLKNWDSVSNDAKPEDLRDKTKEEVIAHLCQPNGEGKVHNMSLVFGDNCPSMGGSYWYGGKCWNCAQDRAQDKYGNCCAKGQVDVCGFCPGKCPNGGVCNTETKMCVECISDAQCTGRADGKLKCDTSINKCVECLNVGGLCSGTGPGTGTVDKYCMKNHTCQECDTTQHLRWNKDLDICECATPLIAIGETCFDGCCVNGASCHNGVCVACWADYDDSEERKPGFCSLEKPLCQNGVCETCPAGQVWNTLLHKCAECNADTDCANNKVCNTALGICQCSADRPHWNGSQCMECLTDYEAGAGACPTTDKPVCNKTTADWHCEACPTGLIWNSTLHKCTGCHSDTDCAGNQICEPTTGMCQCPTDKPHWNGSLCMECLTDYEGGTGACGSDKPVCNKTTPGDWRCEVCPTGLIWNATLHKCAECNTDADCPDGKVCNTTQGICSQCPASAPYLFSGKCLQCEPKTHKGCDTSLWCKSATETTKACVNCFVDGGTTYGCSSVNGDPRTACDENANNGMGVCECPTGVYNTSTKACAACTHNYGAVKATKTRVPCPTMDKPICDKPSGECFACPTGQVWNEKLKKCAECNTDAECGGGRTCSSQGMCICPNNGTWNPITKQCYYEPGTVIFDGPKTGCGGCCSLTSISKTITLFPGKYEILVRGAGGGHSCSNHNTSHNGASGALGGSGGSMTAYLQIKEKQSVKIVTGRGGYATYDNNGVRAGTGGDSSVGNFITCTGGTGGYTNGHKMSGKGNPGGGGTGGKCTYQTSSVTPIKITSGISGKTMHHHGGSKNHRTLSNGESSLDVGWTCKGGCGANGHVRIEYLGP